MVWEGRQEVTGFAGGKDGGYVQLGTAIVPPKAQLTFEGIKGSPDVAMRFEVRDGRPECVEIHVRAKPDGRGIRTADLLLFNLDNQTASVFTDLAIAERGDGTAVGPGSLITGEDVAVMRRAERDVREAGMSRRGSVTRAELEDVARVFRDHVDDSPTSAVREVLGYGSDRTAARRIKQAEEAGLLPTTERGRKRKAD
jgi:hypothetical protein